MVSKLVPGPSNCYLIIKPDIFNWKELRVPWVGSRFRLCAIDLLFNDLIRKWLVVPTMPTRYIPLYTFNSYMQSSWSIILANDISISVILSLLLSYVQYIPRHMHTVFALLCFVVVIHWLIFPYPSGLLHWHCGSLTIAPVPAKHPWWIWINTSCEFIMNDCITTTEQSTTKPCAYFLGYTV